VSLQRSLRSRGTLWGECCQTVELVRNHQHTNNSPRRSEEHLSLSPEVGHLASRARRPRLLAA
jgi:hypothetical protein